ncbi:DNA-binding protein Ewg isoform X2 [Eupeodes corollae]|uniref:DNA-binding protein Ewg isoform X2 n=1 Tax=Eupeodes corollae TaxID=290404 RepID=UPI002493755D|nr:DNA-binding protein Ewg isoform X2 [Eupeodes corollae]
MNVTTVSTGTTTHSSSTMNNTTYKIEMIDDEQLSIASDDDDDDVISSDGVSVYDDSDMVHMSIQDEVATQLAAAGPVGVAAAAAIASSKKRKRPHSFETNPSVRKRQQNRLLRKLRGIIYEFTGRVGKQAVVLVATPGKPNTSYKVFGAKPLEDVVRNLKNIVMEELETALAQQAPPPPTEDPTLFELPPLIIDGIPTPVEKMTQAQLRAFIPLMLKYSTGRGKPGWGRESTRPPWWPKELPWANVRMDARTEEEKQKISWTHALRKIVINCYKYHGREDLLPTFADEDDKVTQIVRHHTSDQGTSTVSTVTSNNNNQIGVLKINNNGTIIQNTQTVVQSNNNNNNQSNQGATKIEIHTNTGNSNSSSTHQTTIGGTQYTQTVLSTIQNADGTVSLIQVDPNNPIITLPDGTTAQVQGVATLHQGEGGATIQTVQSLSDVNGHENMTVDLTEAQVGQDGQIYITADDGQGYPVSVSNMITVPVSASMYQSMIANIQQLHTNSDGTVCITPMQVDSNSQNNNLQYYSVVTAPGNSNRAATPNMPANHVGGRIVHTIAQTIASTVAPQRCQTFNSPSNLSNSSHRAHQQQPQHSITKVFISNSNNTVGDNRISTNNNSIIINCNSGSRSSVSKNKNNNIICENNKNLSAKQTNKISKRRKQNLNKTYAKQVNKEEPQLVDEIDLNKTAEIKIEKIEK